MSNILLLCLQLSLLGRAALLRCRIVKPRCCIPWTSLAGKLSFVDLAGSERVDKTAVEATRYKEAQNISKTLTCVSDVLCTLKAKAAHVPIRTSRLTHLLQDSLCE